MESGKNTGFQRTVKKQVIQRLSRVTTKTGSRNVITKRRKQLSGVQNTVGNLPGKINNRTINVEKEELAPSRRQVQLAKGDEKLLNTVGNNGTVNQQQRIRRFSGQRRHRSNCQTRPHRERTSTGEEAATGRQPGRQKGPIKTGQPTKITEPGASRENLNRRNTPSANAPERKERNPSRRGDRQASHPLQEKRPHLQLHINNREATRGGRLNHPTGDQITLTTQKKLKNKLVKLTQNKRGHLNQGHDIPDSRQTQCINNKSFPRIRKGSLTQREQDILYSRNTRPPVILQGSQGTKKNTQDFELDGPLLDSNRTINMTIPSPQPQTLTLGRVQFATRALLIRIVDFAGSKNSTVRCHNDRRIISILRQRG